ncbi:MAG: hypothetical protein M4579_000669 [Chaenotheca gracillima]|nr:MAG: hypothetical protein M4579_000669 [Chaenotheca gracillima]
MLKHITTASRAPISSTSPRSGSDSESHRDVTLTPEITPADTPTPSSKRDSTKLDLERVVNSEMDLKDNEGAATVDKAEPAAADNASPSKPEMKQPKAVEASPKKKICKAKHKQIKKSKPSKKKKAKDVSSDESDSSSSSDDSSSSSSDDDASASSTSDTSSSESDSEDEAQKKKKKKSKTRKALLKKMKLKSRRKGKSRKPRESSEESEAESLSESEASDSPTRTVTNARQRKKLRAKALSRAAKLVSSDSDSEVEDEVDLESIRAQIDDLNANIAAIKGKSGKRDKRGKTHKLKLKGLKLKDGSSKKKRKRASKLEFKRVDQLWDRTIHNYKLTDTAEDADADEYDQYIFTVKRKFDWEGKHVDTVVDIKSKALKEALNQVMDGVKGVSLVEETPTVDPNMLFLYLEELRTAMKVLKKKNKTQKKRKVRKANARQVAHVKVLLKYLDEDYAETKKNLYPLLESNLITFDLLWALFKPNTIAYTPTYGNVDEPRAFKVEYSTKESTFMRGTWYSVEGRYLEYDGKSFGMGTMEVDVDSFKGARKITSLATYPLKYHKEEEKLKLQLIERGRKFVALQGMKYRFHKGMAFYKKKRSVIKVNINGRVMVDPAIHRRINPNYPISNVKPQEAEDEYMEDSDDESCCCCGSDEEDEGRGNGVTGFGDDDDKERTKLRVVIDDEGNAQLVRVPVDDNGEDVVEEKIAELDGGDNKEEEKKEREFTEEELLLASPVVLGFAFSEKLWLEFTVSGINDIEWNEGAFDSLVLPENQKSIVKALVESHTFHAAENIDDVIQGKGKGLVAVLHGPPGTGKTLTAEGIAELLKCPLYMVSAGELGTDPRTLEAELNKILDIAHSWGAVLLLDEADVFLEKRTIQDIHRNALVSIFLRLLEYFQGILFLTTNRVETFDDAFQSRIHVALRYGELNTKAKKTVWKMFLERVRAKESVETAVFKEADFDALARNNLNGRQIKNCVRTAQALAVNNAEKLSMEHIKRVLDVAESFDHDLRGGTGYMDAMRSYT